MPGRVTTHIDRHRQTSDVGSANLDTQTEQGGATAETLGANAHCIDGAGETRLHVGKIRIGIRSVEWLQQRLLRQFRDALEIAADAYANDERRTRLRSGGAYRLQDELFCPGLPVRGLEHRQPTAILGA